MLKLRTALVIISSIIRKETAFPFNIFSKASVRAICTEVGTIFSQTVQKTKTEDTGEYQDGSWPLEGSPPDVRAVVEVLPAAQNQETWQMCN